MPYLAVVSSHGKCILELKRGGEKEQAALLAQYPHHIRRTFATREEATRFLYPEIPLPPPPTFTPLLKGTLAYLTTVPNGEGLSYQVSLTSSAGETQIFKGSEIAKDSTAIALIGLEHVAARVEGDLFVYTDNGRVIELLRNLEQYLPPLYASSLSHLKSFPQLKLREISSDHPLIRYLKSL